MGKNKHEIQLQKHCKKRKKKKRLLTEVHLSHFKPLKITWFFGVRSVISFLLKFLWGDSDIIEL